MEKNNEIQKKLINRLIIRGVTTRGKKVDYSADSKPAFYYNKSQEDKTPQLKQVVNRALAGITEVDEVQNGK